MSPKNKKGKKLTSTIMALAMTVTTTFQMPIISMASEIESSVAVESQIEEGTSEESVSVQSETTAQTNAEQTNSVIEETSGTTEATNDATQVSDEVQATVAEATARSEGRVKASAGCNSSTSVRRDENADGMALSGIGGETDLPVGYPN